jgi:glycosyltransferase involved in cell wall biosynthesis
VLKDHNSIFKIIIDYTDGDIIDEQAYNWCDVYSKININPNQDESYKKLLVLGPSFGIRIYSKFKTIVNMSMNLIKAYKRIENKKKFLSDYKAQLQRPNLEDYFTPTEKENNYIYFVSSLWKKETKTNNFRANFMNVIKNQDNIRFEGGFAPRTKNDVAGFHNLIIQKRESIQDYVVKTKKSLISFNTPAVLDCHGWKLAEFMASGNAIISTEISRKLPFELINGEHILVTDGSEEDILEKVKMITENQQTRIKLEQCSRAYFNEYLAPDKALGLILARLPLNKQRK